MATRESEKIILIVVVAFVIILVVGTFSMMAMMSGYGYGGYGWDGMGPGFMSPGMMGWGGIGYGWWMPIVGVVFLIVVIVGLYLVFSGYRKPEKPATGSALDILKERYAKGEITEEQYQKMKKEIE
jgi:putative membrane protein